MAIHIQPLSGLGNYVIAFVLHSIGKRYSDIDAAAKKDELSPIFKRNTLSYKVRSRQFFQHRVNDKHPKDQLPIVDLTTFQAWFG